MTKCLLGMDSYLLPSWSKMHFRLFELSIKSHLSLERYSGKP